MAVPTDEQKRIEEKVRAFAEDKQGHELADKLQLIGYLVEDKSSRLQAGLFRGKSGSLGIAIFDEEQSVLNVHWDLKALVGQHDAPVTAV